MDSLSSEIENFFITNKLPSPELTSNQIEQLNLYLDELKKWNKKINLVSDREIPFLHLHILDSLILLPFIDCGEILDLGSGGGFPAIPLAIALPQVKFTLIESRSKKCSFLNNVSIQLKLNNVKILNTRVENFQGTFPCITARAFQPLPLLLSTSFPFLEKSGKIYSHISGKQLIPEDNRYVINKVFFYTLPGVTKKRRIVIFQKNG